jgi:hypothetical protein
MSATATKRPELSPGLPLTYAARVGGSVHVELELPKVAEALGEGAQLRARSKGRVLTAPLHAVDRAGVGVVSADLPAADLAPGSWRLQLRPAEGKGFQGVRAFVLVPADGPIALLAGEPEPAQAPPRRSSRLSSRFGAVAGSVLDAAVAQLDPNTAERTRTRLRQLARRLPL